MARHLALVRWRSENNLERLMADPEWCDPRMAGWWIWGCSCWIGSGWCSGTGPWIVGPDGRITKRPKSGAGVSRQRPHVSDDGQGVNAQTAREPGVKCQPPHLSNNGQGVNVQTAREPGVKRQISHVSDDGRGVNLPQAREPGVADEPADVWTPDDFHPMTMPEVRAWFAFLSARLRHVRILNGDWTRLVTNGAIKTLAVRTGGVAGVFLDPPYADTAGRCDNLYAHDSLDVAHAVHDWALRHGEDKQLRIVVAGFEGEDGGAFEAAGWRTVEWFKNGYLSGGMGNVGGGECSSTSQQHRERLWCSPHCLKPATHSQLSLFDHLNN